MIVDAAAGEAHAVRSAVDAGRTASPQTERTLRAYARTLRRRKWVVAQAMLLVPLLFVAWTVRAEPSYEASASVLLVGGNMPFAGSDSSGWAERRARTAVGLASMPVVANGVLRRVDLPGVSAAEFLRRSSVQLRGDSDILDFRVRDRVPGRARALATAYAREFIVVSGRLQARAAADAVRVVRDRLRRLGAGATAAAASAVTAGEQDLVTRVAGGGPEGLLVRRGGEAVQVEPRPVRNIAFGAVLGLFVGVALAFLWDALNTRVRDVDELGTLLGLPLIGSVREGRLARRGLLALEAEPHGPEAEAFRILRANLEFANVDHQARVVLVTGGVDGEGRSTVAANLALAFAFAGRRVILADLDLRHPVQEWLFALEGHAGVSDVVLGHVPLESALVPVPLRGAGDQDVSAISGALHVLPAGPTPPNSGEFVGTRALAGLVAELADRAEIVLLDAPPLLPVGDARTLSSVADALLVVTSFDTARRRMLEELRRVLAACPTLTLGFVATHVNADQHDTYGGYYRRSAPRRLARRHAA